MQIISHRGFWNSSIEKNSLEAIRNSLINGYGFESDLRDFQEHLVISHNIATKHSPLARQVWEMISEINKDCCFAINVKADGLKEPLLKELKKYNITNYFTFDMSVPQMIEYLEMDLRVFSRQSEFETQPVLYDKVAGVWIDGFYDTDWITQDIIDNHIENGKQVCIVSPELHMRPYDLFWKRIKSMNIDFANVMLCTDLPDRAKIFFEG